jgi:hypothetical protein
MLHAVGEGLGIAILPIATAIHETMPACAHSPSISRVTFQAR